MTTRRALLQTGLLLPWTLSPSGNLSQAATTTKAPADAKVKYVAWEDAKHGPALLGLPASAPKPAP